MRVVRGLACAGPGSGGAGCGRRLRRPADKPFCLAIDTDDTRCSVPRRNRRGGDRSSRPGCERAFVSHRSSLDIAGGDDGSTGEWCDSPGGSASSFGNGEEPAGPQLRQAPTSFSVPGFYGHGTQQFTVGEGRLARPRFRFTGNISIGYDDNVFQTPTHPASTPEQKVNVLVSSGTPATTATQVVPSGDPNVPDSVQTVTIPGDAGQNLKP